MKSHNYPRYLRLADNGGFESLIQKTSRMLASCSLCPRKCVANRLKEEKGFCRTGSRARVYSYSAHHGEEPPVSGSKGSGTIFFSSCNMKCVYCQNFEFSQLDEGKEVTPQDLAAIMVGLQEQGCHNINLVTPTHVLPQILEALFLAIQKGLRIPIVYNTSGYELAETIKLLDGIVDIFLPDMRYGEDAAAETYSSASGYTFYNQAALLEMYRQVGPAEFDDEGIIKKGMIIRHLVLPNGLSGTEQVMKFIAERLSTEVYISLMSQYYPYHKAGEYQDISRRISAGEYEAAKKIMEKYGLFNGWVQESHGLESLAGVHLKRNV